MKKKVLQKKHEMDDNIITYNFFFHLLFHISYNQGKKSDEGNILLHLYFSS